MLFRKVGSLNAMAGVKCGEINSPESAELIAPMSSLSASLRSDLQSLVNGEMSITSQFTLARFQLGAHMLPQVLDYAQIYLLVPITGYPLDPKGPTLFQTLLSGPEKRPSKRYPPSTATQIGPR